MLYSIESNILQWATRKQNKHTCTDAITVAITIIITINYIAVLS